MAEDNTKLNPKQEQFSQLYASAREFRAVELDHRSGRCPACRYVVINVGDLQPRMATLREIPTPI